VLPDVRVLSWPRNLGPGAEEGGFLNFYIRLVTVDDYSWASGVAGIGDVLLDETAAGAEGTQTGVKCPGSKCPSFGTHR
jgi:hypothetical protein